MANMFDYNFPPTKEALKFMCTSTWSHVFSEIVNIIENDNITICEAICKYTDDNVLRTQTIIGTYKSYYKRFVRDYNRRVREKHEKNNVI